MDSNGVHYAVINATVPGNLRMRLVKQTYDGNTGTIVYGMLLYPI